MDEDQPSPGSPLPVPPPVPTWSEIFNDPNPNAFIFHCTDTPPLLMSLPRYFVQAATSVFEDMLAVPQPTQSFGGQRYDGQNAPGILAEVRVPQAKGEDFELLLRLTHRDHVAAALKELAGPYEPDSLDALNYLVDLIHMADKFGFTGLRATLRDPLFHRFAKYEPLGLVAVGIHLRDLGLFWTGIPALVEEETQVVAQRAKPAGSGEPEFELGETVRHLAGTVAMEHYGEDDPRPETWQPWEKP